MQNIICIKTLLSKSYEIDSSFVEHFGVFTSTETNADKTFQLEEYTGSGKFESKLTSDDVLDFISRYSHVINRNHDESNKITVDSPDFKKYLDENDIEVMRNLLKRICAIYEVKENTADFYAVAISELSCVLAYLQDYLDCKPVMHKLCVFISCLICNISIGTLSALKHHKPTFDSITE